MFSDTITLFNFHKGYYYPHVLHGVDAVGIMQGANATALNGNTSSDGGQILINTNSSKILSVDNTQLPYVTPKAYEKLADGADAVTFQPQQDFIMIGDYGSTEPINDDDYEAGFYDEINSTQDNIHSIISVNFYSLIPHFEIGVK